MPDDARFAQLALASMPGSCVMVLDRQLRCRAVGGADAWPGGIDPAALLGRDVRDLLPTPLWEATRAHYEAALEGNTIDERLLGSSGGTYRAVYGPAVDDGRVVGVIVRFREVGAVEEAEHAAAQALELFELSFTTAPIGKALIGPNGQFIKVNPALCALVDRKEADLLGCTFQDITHPADLAADLALYTAVLMGEVDSYQVDKRYITPTGTVVPVQLNVSAARNPDGTVRLFVAQIQDISARRQAEDSLRSLATHDALTGLWNRAWFHDELHHALDVADRYQHQPAVLFIDLDEFKHINDTYGHLAGDQHLCSVARALTRAARRSDRVARLGGDEFAVLLPDCSGAEAATAALRYADEIEALPTGNGASIGIATYRPGDTVETLCDRADQDMYRAKQAAARMRALRQRPA